MKTPERDPFVPFAVPETVLAELLKKARAILYRSLPDHAWFTQQGRVKFALTLPAKWLDERKVELSAERYQAILDGILYTIKAKSGRSSFGPFPCAYLHSCVEAHMRHHGDDYYQEGKSVRNALDRALTRVTKAKPIVPVVATFAQVHAALKVGRRKPALKPVEPAFQPDLFAASKPADC